MVLLVVLNLGAYLQSWRIWRPGRFYGYIWFIFTLYTIGCVSTSHNKTEKKYKNFFYYATLNYSYMAEGVIKSSSVFHGKYAANSTIEHESGRLIHVVHTENNRTVLTGCKMPENTNIPPDTRWIALIKRGDCIFQHKIVNAMFRHNASAVIVYNNEPSSADSHPQQLSVMSHEDLGTVSIFISYKDGTLIAQRLDRGYKITIDINVGKKVFIGNEAGPKNPESVFWVSVAFIVLMIISLAWLVFYYIQRFRYANAKERLSRKLFRAAKKALSKIPVRTLKTGDKETLGEWEQCAICIENYKALELVRCLPCRHIFHKTCVDPWLLDHRSCPICKLDILRAYRLQVHSARENMPTYELDAPSSSIEPLDSIESPSVEIVHVVPVIIHHSTIVSPSVILHCDNTPPTVAPSVHCNNTPSTDKKASRVRTASLESVNSIDSNECQSLMVIKAHSSGLNNAQ